jgi:hypothetical protein
MMRYTAGYARSGAFASPTTRWGSVRRSGSRLDGYQYSLFALPAAAVQATPHDATEPLTVRAVAPALRPLVRQYNHRCPECAGPLVNGEGCVACPVCGFTRQG